MFKFLIFSQPEFKDHLSPCLEEDEQYNQEPINDVTRKKYLYTQVLGNILEKDGSVGTS